MTLADALIAHDAALFHGGRDGIASLHLIESALARPYSGYHRPIAAKAAALLQSMVNNHGFIDGNKRIAWILVEVLVLRSGYELLIPDDAQIDDLVVAVAVAVADADADGKIDLLELTTWFAVRIGRQPG